MAKCCEYTMPFFGQRLIQAMELKGMSCDELAKRLEVAQSTISTYRADYHYPTANRLRQICEILDCSADWLLGLED